MKNKKQNNKIKIKKEKITLEKLAHAMTKGFSALNKKIDSQIERWAKLTVKSLSEAEDRLGNRILDVEDRLGNKISDVEDRLGNKISDIEDRLGGEIKEIKSDIRYLKGEINELREETKKGIDKMLTIADHMAKKYEIWQQENAIGANKDYELQKSLENHENRIIAMEQKIKV